MKDKLRLVLIVLLVSALSLGAVYMSVSLGEDKETKAPASSEDETGEEDKSSEAPESKVQVPIDITPEKTTVSFAAVGDNLIHDNIYKQAAARSEDGGFDFQYPYRLVEKLIKGHDIAFINQESPIAEDIGPLSGYPRFNSPKAVGEEMVKIGFNLIGIANNHMFDMNEEGLLAHMDFWESQDILMCMGAWRSEEDMKTPLLLEKNDITFGFIPMTEHTNGLNAKKGSDIRYIRTDEWDLIQQQLDMINEQADFQVASIHWGIENSLDVSPNQRALAKKLSDAGIDLIIGHHPHTLQPMEWIEREDGTRTLVVYSLGNFISSMLDPQNMLGGVLDMTIEKDMDSGETYIKYVKLRPIVTHYEGAGRNNVRIYPLDEYPETLATHHGIRINHPNFTSQMMADIVDKNIPKEFLMVYPFRLC